MAQNIFYDSITDGFAFFPTVCPTCGTVIDVRWDGKVVCPNFWAHLDGDAPEQPENPELVVRCAEGGCGYPMELVDNHFVCRIHGAVGGKSNSGQ